MHGTCFDGKSCMDTIGILGVWNSDVTEQSTKPKYSRAPCDLTTSFLLGLFSPCLSCAPLLLILSISSPSFVCRTASFPPLRISWAGLSPSNTRVILNLLRQHGKSYLAWLGSFYFHYCECLWVSCTSCSLTKTNRISSRCCMVWFLCALFPQIFLGLCRCQLAWPWRTPVRVLLTYLPSELTIWFRPAPGAAVFITLIVKNPIIQIFAMLIGLVMIALEFPVPQLKGLAIQRSFALKIVLLLFQTFLTILYYQVSGVVCVRLCGDWTVQRVPIRLYILWLQPVVILVRKCWVKRWRKRSKIEEKVDGLDLKVVDRPSIIVC